MTPLDFGILALASYRVTRLIVLDSILDEPRSAFFRACVDEDGEPRGPVRGSIVELLSCSFCTGVWVSMGVWAAWEYLGWSRAPITVAGIAGAQALLSSRNNA